MLFTYYSSLEEVLRACYPEFAWDASKFLKDSPNRVVNGYWKNNQNLLDALDKAGALLGIKQVT